MYIVLRGIPTTLEVGIFAGFAVPILIACYLSRTGHYERAHLLLSLSVTVLVIPVAVCTGGITSFAAIWLALVPLEAAFSASRRVITLATIFALIAVAILTALGMMCPRNHDRASISRHARCVCHSRRDRVRRRPCARHHPSRRGQSLSVAGGQHDRCHHSSRSEQICALRLAVRGNARRSDSQCAAWQRPVRSGSRCRSTGVPHCNRRRSKRA